MPLMSLKDAKVIAKGHAARRFEMTAPDAKAVKEQTGLLQGDYAKLMRVSVKTLQNWEQHRRNPTGPAAALLKIVSTAPEVALKSLHGAGDGSVSPPLSRGADVQMLSSPAVMVRVSPSVEAIASRC